MKVINFNKECLRSGRRWLMIVQSWKPAFCAVLFPFLFFLVVIIQTEMKAISWVDSLKRLCLGRRESRQKLSFSNELHLCEGRENNIFLESLGISETTNNAGDSWFPEKLSISPEGETCNPLRKSLSCWWLEDISFVSEAEEVIRSRRTSIDMQYFTSSSFKNGGLPTVLQTYLSNTYTMAVRGEASSVALSTLSLFRWHETWNDLRQVQK